MEKAMQIEKFQNFYRFVVNDLLSHNYHQLYCSNNVKTASKIEVHQFEVKTPRRVILSIEMTVDAIDKTKCLKWQFKHQNFELNSMDESAVAIEGYMDKILNNNTPYLLSIF